MSRTSLVLRSLFLIGFVVAMPLLALPSVARQLDRLLYGESESAAPSDEWQKRDDTLPDQDVAVHATYEAPLADETDAGRTDSAGVDRNPPFANPPDLALAPDFPMPRTGEAAESTTNSAGSPTVRGSSPTPPLSRDKRIDAVRQRLEDLGADYILLDSDETTGEYRFQCRMLVSAGSAETQLFEVSGRDAVSISEQVLSEVEKWRAKQLAPP